MPTYPAHEFFLLIPADVYTHVHIPNYLSTFLNSYNERVGARERHLDGSLTPGLKIAGE
jgi:hypothetical protein